MVHMYNIIATIFDRQKPVFSTKGALLQVEAKARDADSSYDIKAAAARVRATVSKNDTTLLLIGATVVLNLEMCDE
jgi:hypothetical protein